MVKNTGNTVRVTGVIDEGIQGLQCNLCVNASVHTDPGGTGQGLLGLLTREYRDYSVTFA